MVAAFFVFCFFTFRFERGLGGAFIGRLGRKQVDGLGGCIGLGLGEGVYGFGIE